MTLLGKLGFIGGGRMGEALIQGILKSEIIAAPDILVTDPVADRREYLAATYGIKTYDISADEHIWTTCGTVILAVKPQIMKDVLQEARAEVNDSHLLISIAAGIQSFGSLERFHRCLGFGSRLPQGLDLCVEPSRRILGLRDLLVALPANIDVGQLVGDLSGELGITGRIFDRDHGRIRQLIDFEVFGDRVGGPLLRRFPQ